MTIERFSEMGNCNEDTILDMCGFPDILALDDYRFYDSSENVAFLFLNEDDDTLKWIKHPDTFSLKVYEQYRNKVFVVGAIDKKNVAVFISKEKYPSYKFYGIYKLIDGYCSPDGKVQCDTHLTFILEHPEYVL